jgi:glycosyltransferase involved in cell wall biosynthesis
MYVPFVFPVAENKFIHRLSQDESLKVLMIGKYTKRKDQKLLIEVTEALHQVGMPIELDIFGEPADRSYKEELLKHIEYTGSGSYIRLHDHIPYPDILQQYTNHHLFVLPSYDEPAAYSIVEAQAYGLPVICSDECGTKCYIEANRNGFVFKARDKSDLILKIKQVFKDPLQYDSLSKGAKEFSSTTFNPIGFIESIHHLIDKK